MKRMLGLCFSVVCLLLAPVSQAGSAQPGKQPPSGKVQYARDILPILSANCFVCHGPDEKMRKGGLRLDVGELAVKELKSGSRAIVPGAATDSEMVARIFATGKERMPPPNAHKELKDTEKQLLKRWIEEGAAYQRHWAFLPPERPALPALKARGWVRNPIDAFVLARLEAEGLHPAAEADRYTLARRVALDLTGLQPTLAAVDRFVNDKSPNAYEKFVDGVLASPAYGERWAQVWLDLARYADSNGFAEDQPRTIWKFRDWVIDAVNANMPFDRFTIEQIAGDLLPNPSVEQLLATAFHRNTLTNTEGGTDDEEWRVAAVVDRVNTTMQVWMGITIGCAQCHDHKYDPISQVDYYRMFAIFNQTQDSDKGDNSPTLPTPTPEQERQRSQVQAKIDYLQQQLDAPNTVLDTAQDLWEQVTPKEKLPANIKAIVALDPTKRSEAQKTELTKYYRSIIPELKKLRDETAALQKQLAGIKITATPIMRELPDKQQRKTHVMMRGNFLAKGAEVTPGYPAVFASLLTHGTPSADLGRPTRLDLGRWLIDGRNPLAARVAVNRYWEQIFGVGLVETPEDWGIRGKLPNHPELLDWLATEFAQRWDVKQLLKLIVTSSTYRQSTRVTPEMLDKDPGNRLFGRGPRFRSSAEAIRDQSLFAAGLLSPKMHGPPVRPARPKLGLSAAFGPTTDWETSAGDDKHRRGLYTLVRRSAPYPSMTTFDAPDRNVCTVQRPRTNTPLQALVTLNDPCFVEAAQGLARRIVKEGGASVEQKVAYGFRLCVTRPPSDAETRRLVELYQKARAEYAANAKDAALMATQPLGPLPAGMDAVDLAAWTVVGNVLLNLDEMFTKR